MLTALASVVRDSPFPNLSYNDALLGAHMLNTRSNAHAIVFLLLSLLLSSPNVSVISLAAGRQVEARAEALLSRMSLQEKIGQLTQVGTLDLTPEQRKDLGDLLPGDSVSIEDHVRRGEAGSILWTTNPISSSSCSMWPWKKRG
jgi:hypothetical protein